MRIWAREEAIEETLADELADGEARRLHARELTWDALIDALAWAAGARPLPAVAGRLALREACVKGAAGSSWAGVAQSKGFLAAAAGFIEDCERAGVEGDEVTRAAKREGHAHLARLGAVLAAYQKLCEPLGASRAARQAIARRWLERGGALPWELAEPVRVSERIGWQPADVELVVALGARVPGGVQLGITYEEERAEIFAGLGPVLASFEARTEAAVELHLDAASDGLAGALYRAGAVAEPGELRVRAISAASELAERRAVAAWARRLVDGGAAPERICVAARTPEAIGTGLAEELGRVGLALDDRRGPGLDAAPVAQLALRLLDLPSRGFVREDVIAVAGSQHVEIVPGLQRLARAAGLPALDTTGRARLQRLPGGGRRAAEALARLLGPVEKLPDQASLPAHAAALAALLATLGVPARARRYQAPAADLDAVSGLEARIDRGLARDQVAIEALEELLGELARAAPAVGLGTRKLSRTAFAALLADLMAQTPLRGIGARGGAIKLVHLRDLPARRFDHVIVPGLTEGAAPARGGDDGVWGARERRALNELLGRRVVAVAPGDGDERTPWETLMLWGAARAARETLTLSHARAMGGRPVARSPFVDEVVRAAPWAERVVLAPTPVPPAAEALAPADLLARAALELWAEPGLRLPGRDARPARPQALYAALHGALPARLRRLAQLARIERARWRWFARDTAAGPHSGVIGRLAQLPARAGGGLDRPISPGNLEKLANCPYTFFARKVLGVGEDDEAGDAPESRSVGSAAHDTLALFYARRRDAGALPLAASDGDRRELEAALDDVFAALAEEGVAGHVTLWAIERARLIDDLWRLVEREATEGTPGGGVPRHFELGFGDDKPGSLPALRIEVAGAEPLYVGGRIDRVDLAHDGRLVVLDYKLGRKAGQEKKLKPGEAGQFALQLPVYALAARAGLAQAGAVAADAPADAAFVSLRDGEPTKLLGASLGGPAALAGLLDVELPARLAQLAGQVRGGEFAVDPHDCRWCAYKTTCRVVALREDEEDGRE